ncbi:Fic family protein [Pedobacter sp. V48]|uniref:Fic family protein n=1 Tax=Pedobacter sp. V48 TaxID=509635 RepID=UPI0003E4585C|nr:Fic family protein [Pedobacter sp. V48]ETZ23605.1 hypothetical protein N824_19305 [Pedobacter sp. V48]
MVSFHTFLECNIPIFSNPLRYLEAVKLAVQHYQFESIHPFYDGNGRTGRIINVLYLCLHGLLDSPVHFSIWPISS